MAIVLTTGFLLLFAVIPTAFWFGGKRWFGHQTHPAAIFILACMASALVLSLANVVQEGLGRITLLWVTVNFLILSLVKKLREKKPQNSKGEVEGDGT